MNINDIIRQVRFAGLGPSLSTLRYSIARDSLDRRNRTQETAPASPGSLQETRLIPGGARFQFERAELEVVFLAPDLVRASWEPATPPIPYALARTDWPQVSVTHKEKRSDQGHIESLASDSVRVVIHEDGTVTYQDWSGKELRIELPPEIQGKAWTQRAILSLQAHVYGLGERATSFDHSSGSFQMWNRDPRGRYEPGTDPLYLGMPVYQVVHPHASHLVFFENSFPAVFSFEPFKNYPTTGDKGGIKALARFEGGMLRTYFIPGKPAQALERYTELTGRAPMPPRWALGYHQSRWGYKSEADIRSVVDGFQEHDLPLSAIHLDIDYMEGYRVFTVDKTRFPDLAGLVRDLEERDVRLVTILDPGVKRDPQYPIYQEGLSGEAFCKGPDGEILTGVVWPGESVFPDFTKPETRSWWAGKYQMLLDAGVAGIWHDMNEPTSFTAWGDMTLPLNTRHKLEGRGGDHLEAHNLYGLLMNRAGFEALQEYRPAQRPWLLSRSGWAGTQRYAWNWTADVESSWESLHMTIPTVLGLGLSGLPYSGVDIGGFSGDPSAELYTRWFQMAAFLPFFRTHSALTTSRREPWVYGEPYTSIVREFLQLRYQLMPYLYSLAWEASQTGHPIARPLFWIDPDDEALHQVEDTFLLGDALLVAPVLKEAATGRTVRLPSGGWYSFWEDIRYQGPGFIRLGTSLERIPLLVRAGSILAMEAEGRLILHLYPPDESSVGSAPQATGGLDLFSDAGDGPASGLGPRRVDQFRQSRDGEELNLIWETGSETGWDPYPFPYEEVQVQLHGPKVKRARIDGLDIACQENRIRTKPFHQIRFGNW